MDCKEFKTIVADLFDKEVSPETQKACNEHISHCAECRDYYEDLLATADLLRPKHSPVSQKPIASNSNWMKIAAVFIGVLFISGIAFAAYYLMSAPHSAPEGATIAIVADASEASSGNVGRAIHFDDVRLDSILSVVSAHYGKTTHFRNDEAKAMKFIMTWVPDSSLTSFIDGLNMFDGLQLTLLRDTIFVEVQEGKEDMK